MLRRGVRRRLSRVLPLDTPSLPRRRPGRQPRLAGPVAVCVAALAAGVAAGPVAALLALAYAGLAAIVVTRSRTASRARRRRMATLDAIADAAAALRAGCGVPAVSVEDETIERQVAAALVIARDTGAPLAELLERIEEQHRAAARLATRAAAEAAGARATAFLLLVLPAGGVALGHLIGVRALPVLLGTAVGGACALGAVLLQLAGLAWVARIAAHREPAGPREIARNDLPLAAELLAAVLRAGVPVDHGVLAVAAVLPLGDRLVRVGRALRLGAPAGAAWRHLADLDGAHRLVAAAVRSAGSGGAFAGTLRRIAADLRADDADRVEARARRAAVLLVLPLGLCFLPAFVLAGLTPVVIAVVGELSQ
jgi:Flp pilus assembly protein TadB